MVISSYIIDFSNAKASTYSASGGKNPDFLYFQAAKRKICCFFLVAATALGPSSKDAPRKSVLTALKIIEIQNGKLSVVKKQ